MELKYIIKQDEENIIKNINTLTIDECNKYLTDKNKLVCLDPGNFAQFQWLMKNNVYKYTACRRRFETYTKRCNEMINKEKIKHKIFEKETALSNINSRNIRNRWL